MKTEAERQNFCCLSSLFGGKFSTVAETPPGSRECSQAACVGDERRTGSAHLVLTGILCLEEESC